MGRLLRLAATLEGEELERFLRGLPAPVRQTVFERWFWQAHGGQKEPEGEWRVWLLMAGRGFGKTLAGAQWVWARTREVPRARVALVGGNIDDVLKVMIEGPGGLRAAARAGEDVKWVASRRRLDFSNGAQAFAYSAERPDKLRGPEHHFAWCDELAKWAYADGAWDNLMLTMRLGERPRTIVTTTPKTVPIVRRIRAMERTAKSHGRSDENVHSAEDFRAAVRALYGGTRLGRQELDGELIEDVEGSLWPRELIEACRVAARGPLHHASHGPPPRPGEEMKRVVVGVDPPASAEGDACGIVVCGVDEGGMLYVLADRSVEGMSPERWARAVVAAAEGWGADRVVAEANNGGDMVESVLRSVDASVPVRLVHASRGKSARAEPVAARFEAGTAKLAGRFPALEDEMAGLCWGGAYQGPTRSPDRADAMVWAMSELMKPPRAEPRITQL
jgi:phage terminase large subunit-like protein